MKCDKIFQTLYVYCKFLLKMEVMVSLKMQTQNPCDSS